MAWGSRGWSTFEGYELVATPRAILFQSHFWDGPLWLPRSQIELTREESGGIIVRVKDWLMRKNSIDEFSYYNAEFMEKANEFE